ncbi:MAG: ATP synthase subunit a [Clostridia bacterium 41_269]|nr:MAG: ATP synthase subunit a [Clostridia bacterium 41_269]
MHETHYLFHIFGLGVTSTVTTMWAIMLVLTILSILATRNMEKIPKGIQNALEMVVEMLLNFFSGIIGYEKARMFLPFLGTMFLFILISNYSGLIPGAGHVPGLAAPTSTWSVTAGLAITVFFATHIFGVKAHGIGYLKKFLQPVFMLPLNIIEHFVRPLSLSLRLYGNIFGEEMVIATLLGLIPYFVPLPVMLLSVLFGLIQAIVFTLLSSIYFYEATEEHH